VVCLFLLLFTAAKRGKQDASLLLVPMCLQFGAVYSENLLLGINASGHGGPVFAFLVRNWGQLFSWPFPISVQNIADFLTQISILAILVLRFARTRSDEERHASELEAARAVQQVLVPEKTLEVPGFRIESVYKPAGQVGGDFFQIMPMADGALLVVIGDVSGKGMPAAMTVALLVGTLRTLAHYMQSPGEILAAMNVRMVGRSSGGFTTCLALHLTRDGKVTAANAGHLAPYCGGAEKEIENGLPLGLSPHTTYPESHFTQNENEQLTLVTDGVVEARGKDGELFGFARTLEISCSAADAIARTAQDFGQDDDISVISVTRLGQGDGAAASAPGAAETGAVG
jgi:serine phosphatase RsbU (regulator of sigma subunit)